TVRVRSNDPVTPAADIPVSMTVAPLVPRSLMLSLDDGLNLRSFPLALDDATTRSVFAPIESDLVSVQGFDGGGLTYDPDVPDAFNTLQSVDHLHGYWMRTSAATGLPLDGFAIDPSEPVVLDAGYNLVGFLPDNPDSVVHALATVLGEVEVVMGYDAGGLTFDPDVPPEFNTLQVLEPGFGYWIRMENAATLVYPDPLPGVAVVIEAVAPGRETAAPVSARLVPTTEWMNVWGRGISVDGDAIPAGTEIRVSDPQGVVCGVGTFHADGRFRMVPVYRDDPSTEIDEGAEPGDRLTLTIGDALRFEGIEWKNNGDVVAFQDAARLSPGGTLPATTALHQNFPNPFNPTTTVPYDIAVAGDVSVTIFSVTGERVRTLVDEHHGPGRYRAPWDGRDDRGNGVASGVYFYRLTAPEVTLTRKMVVIR
ncbi:MAG: FlgD immunoglobulin-like domain containing protein, partial [Gemmatimonadota bacterium]